MAKNLTLGFSPHALKLNVHTLRSQGTSINAIKRASHGQWRLSDCIPSPRTSPPSDREVTYIRMFIGSTRGEGCYARVQARALGSEYPSGAAAAGAVFAYMQPKTRKSVNPWVGGRAPHTRDGRQSRDGKRVSPQETDSDRHTRWTPIALGDGRVTGHTRRG